MPHWQLKSGLTNEAFQQVPECTNFCVVLCRRASWVFCLWRVPCVLCPVSRNKENQHKDGIAGTAQGSTFAWQSAAQCQHSLVVCCLSR